MLRKVVVFTAVTTAAAITTTPAVPFYTMTTTPPFSPSSAADFTCTIDSGSMVSDGLNSFLAIWASEKRCQGKWLSVSAFKCTSDVSLALASVTHLAASIAGIVADCGSAVRSQNAECGIAADLMVSNVARLTAASASITDKCGIAARACLLLHGGDCTNFDPRLSPDVLGLQTDLGQCTADVGGSINGIFVAANTFTKLKSRCSDGKCPVTVDDVVSILASLGASIAAAVGDCNHAAGNRFDASSSECVGAILSGVSAVTGAAKQGMDMTDACASPKRQTAPARLYRQTAPAAEMPYTKHANFGFLFAALPLTAILSFSVGRRFAQKAQQSENEGEELELESLIY